MLVDEIDQRLLAKIILFFINMAEQESLTHQNATYFIAAHSELCKVLFFWCCLWLLCLFVYKIFQELLNGFTPNSQGRHLVPGSDEFECQVQRSRYPGTNFLPIEKAL